MASAREREQPHDADENPDWVEAWLFDAVQADRSIALSIEMLRWPQRQQIAFHVSVVRDGHPLISLYEPAAPMPKAPSLEVRSSGLWTEIGIQTPLDHVTVDMEAFAVALDDPADVFAGAYGIRTALGSELEWETAGDLRLGQLEKSYDIPCIVHGELLIDELTIEIDGWGWRSHRWGPQVSNDRTRVRGRAADSEWLHSNDTDWELSMQVRGEAPIRDPSTGHRLLQFFAVNDADDAAWIRRIEPAT